MDNINTPCVIFLLEIILYATDQDFIHFNKNESKARGLALVDKSLCRDVYGFKTLLLQV